MVKLKILALCNLSKDNCTIYDNFYKKLLSLKKNPSFLKNFLFVALYIVINAVFFCNTG